MRREAGEKCREKKPKETYLRHDKVQSTALPPLLKKKKKVAASRRAPLPARPGSARDPRAPSPRADGAGGMPSPSATNRAGGAASHPRRGPRGAAGGVRPVATAMGRERSRPETGLGRLPSAPGTAPGGRQPRRHKLCFHLKHRHFGRGGHLCLASPPPSGQDRAEGGEGPDTPPQLRMLPGSFL